ncbi:NEDD8 ultimate buster 1 isoform X3 [Anguilla rostrata]
MAEEHIQAKLKTLLKQQKIQLWNPPFTTDYEAGQQSMKELASTYASLLGFSVSDVESALVSVRSQAVKRGAGNNAYKETCVATLELNLPKVFRKDTKRNNYLETKLDITVKEVMNEIYEKYGLKYIKLILNGKILNPDKRLDEQNVKHNDMVMVLKVSEPERKQLMKEEEEKKRSQNESVKRTEKGFQILSERDGSDDPETTPFLEIADQKGNPLKIPSSEKKALILAMGFHEKGRALMKRKEYDVALCHLLEANDQFGKCDSTLLNTVDNYAVLQLDIVWCYRALEALSCLDDGKQRLQKAEQCFLKCYGEQHERLRLIKGNTGCEEVLFLRLYLLQSLLSYLDGKEKQAAQTLTKAEDLYHRLCLDPGKMTQLMSLGYTEQEARLGLRACHGNMDDAVLHINQRRMEKEEMKQREREKRRRRLEAIDTLVQLGYSKKDAAKALNQTDGDMDRAFVILLDTCRPSVATSNNSGTADSDPDREAKILQVRGGCVHTEVVEAALRQTRGNVQLASQVILNQGSLPPELLSPSPPSSLSEEPSTSSESAGSGGSTEEDPLDVDLVKKVLEDIPKHEEDYLDLTLEEESEVIAQMKSYLELYYASSS